jgi:hypothetical protein
MEEMQSRISFDLLRHPRFQYKRVCAKLFAKLLTEAPFASRPTSFDTYHIFIKYRKLLIMGLSGADEHSALEVAKGMVYEDESV